MTPPKRNLPLLLLLAWITLIFLLSSQNGEQTASTSSGIADWIAKLFYKSPSQNQVNDIHMLVRKTAHFILFFGFGVLTFYAFSVLHRARLHLVVYISVLLTLVVSFFDEWHKIFIPGRHFDRGEALLNVISGMFAITCCILYHKLRRQE